MHKHTTMIINILITSIMKTKILLSFFALLSVTASAQCPDSYHPHLIDLGLPSGAKWACCNVGTSSPEDYYTGFYAWGVTEKQSEYNWASYPYRGTEEGTFQDIGNNIAGTKYDVAMAKMGVVYQMPTKAQFEELLQNCSKEFLDNKTLQFTGPNGKTLTFSFYGHLYSTYWSQGSYGVFRCADLDSDGKPWVLYVDYESSTIEMRAENRISGYYVRAVEGVIPPDCIVIDEVNFPDGYIRNKLLQTDKDGVLTPAEIENMTSLYLYGTEITSFKGLEMFTNLKSLSIHNCQADFSALPSFPNLDYLLLYNCQAATLDLTKYPALTSLDCRNNQLTTLDVSQCPNLKSLYCAENQLTTLDVSHNTAMEVLSCYENQLTALDVSQNTALAALDCSANQLTALDVTQNTAMTELYCSENQLTALNVSKNTALTRLYCYENQLTALDVSQNTALTRLFCYENQLTALDVTQNTALEALDCSGNQLTTLDVSKNTALEDFDCSGNQLTTLDVSKNTALSLLVCHYNQIRGADMDALIESLPAKEKESEDDSFYLYVFDEEEGEGNLMTTAQASSAKDKNWDAVYWSEETERWTLYSGHSHELESVEPVAPGCETPGSAEYWKCSYKYCGMLFADENGEEEIDAPMEIPATGHIWGEWQVTRDAEPGSPGEMTCTCELDPSHQQTRPIYAVTVIGGTASVTQAAEGETVTVTADEDGGDFRQWNVVQGDVAIDETATIVTFDMPDNEVELEALFIQQAELSFEQDEFAADMSETFVAPELINPNALAVTYASSDESVATVDAATGEVTLVGEGDVVITATFEGDDAFYAGEASYTIHVTDTTGISTWGNDSTLDGKPSYNLRGQRARSTEKGVIIRKGKKVLRK